MSVPADRLAGTRVDLQRLATHVLARARAGHGGRFGLRVTASGIATPPFGEDETVVRVTGDALVVERQGPDGRTAAATPLAGLTLTAAAAAADVGLDDAFAPGADAPAVGDPDGVLDLDPAAMAELVGWFADGARMLDAVLPGLGGPTAPQLWPEHFDLGLSASTSTGGVNLGVSPGDAAVDTPYLYVGPWTADRPGDAAYWNAPFGAVATRDRLATGGDTVAAGVVFLREGLSRLGG